MAPIGWASTALLACAVFACRGPVVLEPLPCERIRELPAVEEQMDLATKLHVFQDLRNYAANADDLCAGNRILRGEEPLQLPEPPSAWARLRAYLKAPF